jgi:hypothetical protein
MESDNGRPATIEDGEAPAARGTVRRRIWSAIRLAEVRLRLPIVLVVAAVVIGRWDVLRNYSDRLMRATPTESTAGHPVSTDTEYFCPMDPGVISDWPGRCGVCNMALVRRKKGDAAVLPDGVIARMQLSPYRVQLAGIRTEPIRFRALARAWSDSGFVSRDGGAAHVAVEVPPGQGPWIRQGDRVAVTCSDLIGPQALEGRVTSLVNDGASGGSRRATVSIETPPAELQSGMIASIRSEIPAAALEPFRSMPRTPPPLAPGELRVLYVCADHADSTAIAPGTCPQDDSPRVERRLGEWERIRWWCPMHPAVVAEKPGATCAKCGGMELRPRAIVYAPAGQVLVVPQSAVVDTGERSVAFVESMPGMFDGVEVVLGPRCGDEYPVVRGLEPGQRVAVAGAFLLDAETRLNPSLAAGYFGASGGRRAVAASAAASPSKTAAPVVDAAAPLSPEDRVLAERQKNCPVTGLRLGSMGTPERQVVSGRVVFLCCGGCRSKLMADPATYLAKLPPP